MDLEHLEESVRHFFTKGLAESTQRTYLSGKKRYLSFCARAGVSAVPAEEKLLCSFVAFLAKEGLKYRTIKVYLSAIRHLHIEQALPDPFAGSPMARLEYVTRGIKKQEAEGGGTQQQRLPITLPILHKLKAVWEPDGGLADTKMLWAASALCFFAFLRVGEMTSPGDGAFDPARHLGVDDIAVDCAHTPQVLRVTIKQSKTDPFRKGVELFIGRVASPLCPVAAMMDYLCTRGMATGPLFRYRDGKLLTRQRFSVAVREALSKAGLDPGKYCTHSFRIGAATTAAEKGIEDSVIKTLGRWGSLAYLQYVRLPREQLAAITGRLGNC